MYFDILCFYLWFDWSSVVFSWLVDLLLECFTSTSYKYYIYIHVLSSVSYIYFIDQRNNIEIIWYNKYYLFLPPNKTISETFPSRLLMHHKHKRNDSSTVKCVSRGWKNKPYIWSSRLRPTRMMYCLFHGRKKNNNCLFHSWHMRANCRL